MGRRGRVRGCRTIASLFQVRLFPLVQNALTQLFEIIKRLRIIDTIDQYECIGAVYG